MVMDPDLGGIGIPAVFQLVGRPFGYSGMQGATHLLHLSQIFCSYPGQTCSLWHR